MLLLKKRHCVNEKARESRRKKAKDDHRQKLKKMYKIKRREIGSEKFLLQKCKTELRVAQSTLATLKKLVHKRQKVVDKQAARVQKLNGSLNRNVVKTVNSGTSNRDETRALKEIKTDLENLMENYQKRCMNSAPENGLQSSAIKLGNSLHKQAQEKSCAIAGVANLIQFISSQQMGLVIQISMLIELMTKNCVLSGKGSTIEKVISELNIFMAFEKNKVFATDNQNKEVEIRFQLVLRAKTVEPKVIAAFARTENARQNPFLVYQRMSPTVLHALVAQGERNGTNFTVQDSFPNTCKSIPVDSVHSCFLVDMVETFTRDTCKKHASWVEVENPAVSNVPMHWTVPPAP